MGGGAVGDGGEMTPCLGGWVSTCGTESPILSSSEEAMDEMEVWKLKRLSGPPPSE